MRCHESRMPVERHDHRPAPTLPRELPPLSFFLYCVGHHPAYHHHHPRLTDCLSVCSLPLPPRLSAHLQLNSTLVAFPSSRPVQPSPALLALLELPCPAPAFRPPSPPPLTDRPEKSHHLVSPFRASKNPAHCHPSIHPLRLPSLLPLLFSSGLLCSRLLLSPFSPVCFWSAHSSICGRQKPSVASHPVGLKHPDSGASCSPDLRTNLCRQRHTHTTTTTTIPQQHLTSSWLLSPA